jgi:hypothetical protein
LISTQVALAGALFLMPVFAMATEDFQEYRTELSVIGRAIEESDSPSIFEKEEIPSEEDSRPSVEKKNVAQEKKTTEKVNYSRSPSAIMTKRDFDAMQYPEMDRIAKTYRQIVSESSVPAENKRFIASADTLFADAPVVTQLDASRTYTYSHQGVLKEINTDKFYLPERRKKVEGEGWVVSLVEPAAEKGSVEKSATPSAVASAVTSSSASPRAGEMSLGDALDNRALSDIDKVVAKSSSTGPVFSLETSSDQPLKNDDGRVRRVTVSGRVVGPKGIDLRNVHMRVASTDIEVSPDFEGFFQFPEMPVGSRFEVLVWDENDKLTRRLIPMTATAVPRDIEVSLERTHVIQDLANSFDVVQDITRAGFCAVLDTDAPSALKNGVVFARAGEERYEVKYFDGNALPQKNLSALETSGRFCVFNVQHDLVDIDVLLPIGLRRSFVLHTKPTLFESSVVLNLDSVSYRKVSQTELVDFDETVEAVKRDSSFVFGTPGVRGWYDGQKSATWARVGHAAISADRSYSPVVVERDAREPVYFPLGQEHLEVRWGTGVDALSGFSLLSSSDFRAFSSSDKGGALEMKTPLVLRMLDGSSVDEMERALGVSYSREMGTAFVSVDLAALNLNYSDVRFSVRDTWTGRRLGEFSYIPRLDSANPRLVRFFVGNMPLGQHSLVISDAAGVVHWVDIIRSRPSALQVLSIAE